MTTFGVGDNVVLKLGAMTEFPLIGKRLLEVLDVVPSPHSDGLPSYDVKVKYSPNLYGWTIHSRYIEAPPVRAGGGASARKRRSKRSKSKRSKYKRRKTKRRKSKKKNLRKKHI